MALQRSVAREGVVRDEDGHLIIPASQRPDGTWRPARRVKEGYIPPEEMPLYRSRGVETREKHSAYVIPGLTKEAADAIRQSQNNSNPQSTGKKKKKSNKKKHSEDKIDSVNSTDLEKKMNEINIKDQDESYKQSLSVEEIQKKIKALKKKLKQIEDLEQKISSGQLESPDKDQLEKLHRKEFISKELSEVENLLNK